MVQEISPYEYVLIDVANQFGKDKLTWNERIEWTQSNLPYLEDLIDEAKKPFLYAKAVNALRNIRKGLQTNHLVGLDK
jgi:DNA-directed RNA polymerase